MSKDTLRLDVLNEIKALTNQGMWQTKISQQLGLSRTTVYKAQKQLGLHARLPLSDETEKEILRLLQTGIGQSRIGELTATNKHQVKLVAKKYGICRAKKVAAKKPKENPKIRGRVTDAEKDEIRRLTLAGVRQSVIARKLKITAPSVSKAQIAMGLPTRLVVPPIPEEAIMKLFSEGWGGYAIAKALHVSTTKVFAVAHKNNFHRADKAGWKTPLENERKFIEAIKRRENYIKVLARKYGMGFCRARELAHQVLGTSEFRRGMGPPLSSNFPQKHYDAKVGGQK
jgi:predicted transcriptional regulator